MFGFTIIKSNKLRKMKQLEDYHRRVIDNEITKNAALKVEVKNLSEKLAKFDRPRWNGKFVKINQEKPQ